MMIVFCWFKASGSHAAALFLMFTLAFTPVLIAGIACQSGAAVTAAGSSIIAADSSAVEDQRFCRIQVLP